MKNICNWSWVKSICHLGRSSGVTSLLGGCPLVTAGSHLAPPWHDDCSAAVSPVVTGHCHYQMLSAPGPGLYWAVLAVQAEVRSVTSGGQLRPVTLGTSHALLISLKMKSNNYNHILPQTTTLPSSKQQECDSLSWCWYRKWKYSRKFEGMSHLWFLLISESDAGHDTIIWQFWDLSHCNIMEQGKMLFWYQVSLQQLYETICYTMKKQFSKDIWMSHECSLFFIINMTTWHLFLHIFQFQHSLLFFTGSVFCWTNLQSVSTVSKVI